MDAPIYLSAEKRALVCKFCLENESPISVCNFENEQFRGCGAPFCHQHGLPVGSFADFHFVKAEVEQEDLEQRFREMAAKLLRLTSDEIKEFRACYACLQGETKRKTAESKRNLFLIALFFLVGALTTIAVTWQMPGLIQCSEGSILSISKQQCLKKQEEPTGPNGYLYWLHHKNPSSSDCQIGSVVIGSVFCRCEGPAGGTAAVMLGKNGKQIKALDKSECPRIQSCPADGDHYVRYGECTTSASYYPRRTIVSNHTVNGQPPRCPSDGIFLEAYGYCVFMNCFSNFYYTNLTTMKCVNCPSYKKRMTYHSCTEQMLVPDSEGKVTFYLEIDGSSKWCPPNRGVPAYLQKFFKRYGYYYRKVHRWYAVCPVVKEIQNRTCRAREMMIRFVLKCTSPCKPCEEKWDFDQRKCVPGDKFCERFEYSLMSTGECMSVYNLRDEYAKLGVYVCE